MRAQVNGRGPVFRAGPFQSAVNSSIFHLSFEFQKLFCLVFLVYLLFFHLSYISVYFFDKFMKFTESTMLLKLRFSLFYLFVFPLCCFIFSS
jgi:hypothetical protein